MIAIETPSSPTAEEILIAMMDPREIQQRLWLPNVSEAYLLAALRLNEHTRSIAAAHECITSRVATIAAADRKRIVRAGVAENPRVDPTILHSLVFDRSKLVREQLVKNETISRETRDILARDQLTFIRRTAATGELSAPVLDQLTRDRSTSVLEVVAKRSDLSPIHVDRLRRHRAEVVRKAIVPSITDPEVLREMAEDKCSQVVCAVAANDFTPRDVLIDLSQHRHSDVRNALALNVPWFPTVAMTLCDDADWTVRRTLAWRTAISYVLDRLSLDVDLRVRATVASNSNTRHPTLERLMNGRSIDVAMKAIAHPCPPFDVVSRLQSSSVRRLRLLARERLDQHPELRAPVGRGSAQEPLDQLLHWADTTTEAFLMVKIIGDPACPDSVAEAIIERTVDPTIVEAGAQSPHAAVRRASTRNGACPVEVLERLSRDSDHRVRAAVVWNDMAPLETLRCMSKSDTRAAIRETARNALYHRSRRS